MLAPIVGVVSSGTLQLAGGASADALDVSVAGNVLTLTSASTIDLTALGLGTLATQPVDLVANGITKLQIDLGDGSDTTTFSAVPLSVLTQIDVLDSGPAADADQVIVSGTMNLGGDFSVASTIETTQINADVTTTGSQTYNDPVTLGAAAITLASTGGGDIKLASTVNGATALTVNTSGTTTFGGAVNVTSVTTDLLGTTAINANITTTGAQNYADNVTLGAASHLVTLNGGDINFAASSTVNSALGNQNSLVIEATGAVTFAGNVGNIATQKLLNLTAHANETAAHDANNVIVSGVVNVDGNVALGAADNLTVTGSITAGGAVGISLNSLDANSGDDSPLASPAGVSGTVFTVSGTLHANAAAHITMTGSVEDDEFRLSNLDGISPRPEIDGNATSPGGRTAAIRLGGGLNGTPAHPVLPFFKPVITPPLAIGDQLFVNDVVAAINSSYEINPTAVKRGASEILHYSNIGMAEVKTSGGNNDITARMGAGLPSVVRLNTGTSNGNDNRFHVIGTGGDDKISIGNYDPSAASLPQAEFELNGFSRLWAEGGIGADTIDNVSSVPGLLDGGPGNDTMNSVVSDPTSKFILNKKNLNLSFTNHVSLVVGGTGKDSLFVGNRNTPDLDKGTTFLLGDYFADPVTKTLKKVASEEADSYSSSSLVAANANSAKHGYVAGLSKVAPTKDTVRGNFEFPAGGVIKFSTTIGWLKGALIFSVVDINKLVAALNKQVAFYVNAVPPAILAPVMATPPAGGEGEAAPVALTPSPTLIVNPTPIAAGLTDVNHDGRVSAADALAVINELNASGGRKLSAGSSSLSLDVNGDGYLTALDALLVIDKLNAASSSQDDLLSLIANDGRHA